MQWASSTGDGVLDKSPEGGRFISEGDGESWWRRVRVSLGGRVVSLVLAPFVNAASSSSIYLSDYVDARIQGDEGVEAFDACFGCGFGAG